MARTLTIKAGGPSPFSDGWHEVKITKAKYGTYGEAKFLEMWFDGYSENFTLRVYAKQGKDGEEFAIGNVFRFANAGIVDALDGPDGETIIKYDDSPNELIDKQLNIYLYKDGKYSRALTNVAPTVFENIVEKFTEKDVEFWKTRGEKYYKDYIEPKLENKEEKLETEDIPF